MKGKPFAIITGKGARAYVDMCSAEATRKEVVAGMKLSEAKAVCANLIWKEYDESLYKNAQKQLCRQLIACSPKVSALEPGIFLLDAVGLSYLGGEHKFCLDIQKRTARAGFSDVHIGLADSAFAAAVASKFKRRQYFIVDPDGDAQFLAPLSIKHLPISADMQESLHEVGIRTIGQMISLSQQSLLERFGREGAVAFDLARGIDIRQPSLPPADKEFKSFVDLGSPIELLNEIQFVLKSMIDFLSKQLKQEGWWAEELLLSFYNDDDKFDERPIKLLRPSNHPKFLLEVMKLSLEANPVQREITAIGLSISRFCKESWQQIELDQQQEQEQQEHENMSITLMLQRFVSRLGEDAVVQSIPNDQHIPEHAGAWLPVTGKPSVMPVVPVNVAYINAHAGPSGLVSGLALRKLPVPHPVFVEFKGERPAAITFEGRWYLIQEITEPERLSGLWWERPVRKSYYVALLQPKSSERSYNLLVLLVHDHEENSWQISGIYD